MKKRETPSFLQNNGLQIAFWVVTVVVAIANIWAAYKLAPLAQGLAVITSRVDAHEDEQSLDNSILESRLVRIENKIDQLLLKSK